MLTALVALITLSYVTVASASIIIVSADDSEPLENEERTLFGSDRDRGKGKQTASSISRSGGVKEHYRSRARVIGEQRPKSRSSSSNFSDFSWNSNEECLWFESALTMGGDDVCSRRRSVSTEGDEEDRRRCCFIEEKESGSIYV